MEPEEEKLGTLQPRHQREGCAEVEKGLKLR